MKSNKNLVAVVIPFHKSEMSEMEEKSFRQNTAVLSKYPIFLLLPKGLKADSFLNIVPSIHIVYFNPIHFSSYFASNQFWLIRDIYDYFSQFQYILKCELDAYIFRDELAQWCDKGYHYVGAPWIDSDRLLPVYQKALHSQNWFLKKAKHYLSYKTRNREILVGNGGLSLRKISSFRLVSRLLPFFVPHIHEFEVQEDFIWSFYAASYFPFFSIPDYREALKFSVETQPQKCYELNGHRLPFGCHAWEKYDVSFWIDHIDSPSLL